MGFAKALLQDLQEKLFLFNTELLGEEVIQVFLLSCGYWFLKLNQNQYQLALY